MSKKQSLLEEFLEFTVIAGFITYFIIANAFLGASGGWWPYSHAEIFSWGMFIVLGVAVTSRALYVGLRYLYRRLNPPPALPAKQAQPNRQRFEARSTYSQPPLRKAKNGLRYSKSDYPTSDLPF